MNLYLITLKNGDKYYVVEDSGSNAWEKLKKWFAREDINMYDPKIKWQTICNIASNWNDERIGIFH